MLSCESTSEEIRSARPDTAILPVGSTEQHGPHLPVCTDALIAGQVATAICERTGALLLPTLPYSTCREHRGSSGTVWMNASTFDALIRDMAACLREQGIRRLVLLLAHGGVFIAGPTTREINSDSPDIKVIRVDLSILPASPERAAILECRDNLHACESETSLMLHLAGHLVRRDRIVDCVPQVPRDFLNYQPIFKYSPAGVWGRPSLASREKGAALFELLVRDCISYINSVNAALEL